MQRYIVDVITFPENLQTTSGLSILLHGAISLPDARSYVNKGADAQAGLHLCCSHATKLGFLVPRLNFQLVGGWNAQQLFVLCLMGSWSHFVSWETSQLVKQIFKLISYQLGAFQGSCL